MPVIPWRDGVGTASRPKAADSSACGAVDRERELWRPENREAWEEERRQEQEDHRREITQSASYKRYKRFMKKQS